MRVEQAATGGIGGLLGSLALHLGLVGLVVYGAWIGKLLPLGGAHPGTASAGSIEAHMVSTVPGGAIPMPAPTVAPTKNRLANDLEAEGISRPRPAAAARNSIALPAYNPETLARKEALRDLRKIAQADREKNDDRVAYGAGGKTSINATSTAQGLGGNGGMSFGDANFGSLYTDWVNHLRDRLQYYWGLQPRGPGLPSGIKVVVTLTVHQAGQVDGIGYLSRSSSLEVNGMALASVQQMASAERFPLPAGYAKPSLTVSVAFEIN